MKQALPTASAQGVPAVSPKQTAEATQKWDGTTTRGCDQKWVRFPLTFRLRNGGLVAPATAPPPTKTPAPFDGPAGAGPYHFEVGMPSLLRPLSYGGQAGALPGNGVMYVAHPGITALNKPREGPSLVRPTAPAPSRRLSPVRNRQFFSPTSNRTRQTLNARLPEPTDPVSFQPLMNAHFTLPANDRRIGKLRHPGSPNRCRPSLLFTTCAGPGLWTLNPVPPRPRGCRSEAPGEPAAECWPRAVRPRQSQSRNARPSRTSGVGCSQ